MQMKRPTFTVFSKKLAGILLFKGFVLAGVGDDNAGTNKKTFYFFDSDELQDAIREYGEYSYTLTKERKANVQDNRKDYGYNR